MLSFGERGFIAPVKHLIFGSSDIERHIILEITNIVVVTDCEVNAAESHLSDIHRREHTTRSHSRREEICSGVSNHVCSQSLIPFEGGGDSVVPETEVYARVYIFGFPPCQSFIRV